VGERGRGRGDAFGEFFQDRLKHRFSVLQDFIVPETKHRESLTLQPSVTHRIVVAAVVLPTIGLNDYARTEVHEVGDVRADGLLPAKLLVVQTMCAKVAPQQLLCFGHVFA